MKSFHQGKKSLPIPSLRFPPGCHGAASGSGHTSPRTSRAGTVQVHAGTTGGEAHVEVVKEGDKVVRLVVTCACGERIEVECLYAAGT